MRVPDGDALWKSLENSVAARLHLKKAALAQAAFIACGARLKPLHHRDHCTVAERYLLMTAADSKHRLRRVANYVEDSCQRVRRVVVPRMALPAEDDVSGL